MQDVREQLFIVIADKPAAVYLSCRNISVGSAKVPCRHCTDQKTSNDDYLQGPGFLSDSFLPAIGTLPAINANASLNVLLTKDRDQDQREAYDAANATKKKVLQTLWGLKGGYTFFQAVRGFNIVNRVPHDPMHVFLEGVLKFELYLVFHWIAKALGFGVQALDNWIWKHELAEGEKNDKPAKIDTCHIEGSAPKADGKIKQTAGMVRTLARNLVPMFGRLCFVVM
jgi:hypothetical protein